jgi:hypothetical protein
MLILLRESFVVIVGGGVFVVVYSFIYLFIYIFVIGAFGSFVAKLFMSLKSFILFAVGLDLNRDLRLSHASKVDLTTITKFGKQKH